MTWVSFAKFLLGLHGWIVSFIISEVMRKQTYKGNHTITHALPIDAASTAGIVLILGTILPATSLSMECVLACRGILLNLEGDNPVKEMTIPLMHGLSLKLESRGNGKFRISDMKPLWKQLGLNFTRWGNGFCNPKVEIQINFFIAIQM